MIWCTINILVLGSRFQVCFTFLISVIGIIFSTVLHPCLKIAFKVYIATNQTLPKFVTFFTWNKGRIHSDSESGEIFFFYIGIVPATFFIYSGISLMIHTLFFLGMFSCWVLLLSELGKWLRIWANKFSSWGRGAWRESNQRLPPAAQRTIHLATLDPLSHSAP